MPSRPKPSQATTIKQFTRFATDSNGIEKILRLLQSLCQIVAATIASSSPPASVAYWELRRNFALGRRYLRFFRFLDCFSRTYELLGGLDGGPAAGVREVLDVGKWCFNGFYLALESLTILDTMGFWPTPWAVSFLLEGNKFWFYSLLCSILLGLSQLWDHRPVPNPPRQAPDEKRRSRRDAEGESRHESKRRRAGDRIKRRLVVDLFDLFIPGAVTGWIPTSPIVVGWASALGTVVSMKDVWDRCADGSVK